MITALIELAAFYGDTLIERRSTSCIDHVQRTLLEFFFRIPDDDRKL